MILGNSLLDLANFAEEELIGENSKFKSISIDTRKINKGDIYVSIKGVNFDGDDFIDEAFSKGAIACITEKKLDSKIRHITVKDTLNFLKDLGAYQRKLFLGQVFCITGSNGKTSTKDILSHILETEGSTHKTFENQNNLLGLSLTFLGLKDQDFLVAEIGTNAPGEIIELSSLVYPDIAIITNIGLSHAEGLGSLEEIAIEKSNMLYSLGHKGIAILPRDSDFYDLWATKFKGNKIITFGVHSESNFRVSDIQVDLANSKTSFTLFYLEESINCIINTIGEHNALNAAAALAAVHSSGLDLKIATRRLESAVFPSRRLSVKKGFKGSMIIDDSYNANPESMKAALKELAIDTKKHKVFIGGQMAELGPKEAIYHQEILHFADNIVDEIWCIGDLWKQEINLKNSSLKIFSNSTELLDYAFKHISRDWIILLKGSRSSAIDQIADNLQ